MTDIWQTTNLDEAIAEEFFGWVWMSYIGRPVRGHPDYHKEIRVRQFLPPVSLVDARWIEFLAEHSGRNALADGSEPLAYCYCSSAGPAFVPHFSGHDSAIAELERELRKRNLWEQYRGQLWAQVIKSDTDASDIDEERLSAADCETRCMAALAVVDSRFLSASS